MDLPITELGVVEEMQMILVLASTKYNSEDSSPFIAKKFLCKDVLPISEL